MLKIENSSGKVSAEASDILREVIATREEIIGPAHPETIGAKIGMSDQLYLLWRKENGAADHPFLAEAGDYLDQVLLVDEKSLSDAGIQADLAAGVLAGELRTPGKTMQKPPVFSRAPFLTGKRTQTRRCS